MKDLMKKWWIKKRKWITSFIFHLIKQTKMQMKQYLSVGSAAEAVEYSDCASAEG